jgi:predicted P-loop ATPase
MRSVTDDRCALNLTPEDLASFERLKISAGLLRLARIERVDDATAREKFGIRFNGDVSGIVFPYFIGGEYRTARVRRDNPERDAKGKPENKYISAFGDRRHLYLPPDYEALLADPRIPLIFVEAEKSVLAIVEWARRVNRKVLPIGTGGCWGWSGQAGIKTNANGEREPERGALPEISFAKDGRAAGILFDSNTATNPKVRKARKALETQLRKQGAKVLVLNLPVIEGVNGPDDFLFSCGDQAFDDLLAGKKDETQAGATTAERISKDNVLILNDQGKVKPLLANAIIVLREASEFKGVLAYDEFSLYTVTKNPAPWQSAGGSNWTDYDDSRTSEWLQHRGVFVNSKLAGEAVQVLARENSFHPVRQYLNSVMWDGTGRIDRWLTTYLGAEENSFSRAIGPRWLTSGIARIMQPGCRVDHTLVLEGPQGIQKSTALERLAGADWFSDQISSLDSKDSKIELHGRWILELAELASIRRSQIERIKSFLTSPSDHFRVPYEVRCSHVPRQNIFAGSVNDAAYLADPTGSRRFWPVHCGKIDIDAIARDRDHLWAEAFHTYQLGSPWWLETPELNELAGEQQDERYEAGPWDDLILAWIERPVPAAFRPDPPFTASRDRVTVTDILVHAIGKSVNDFTQRDQNSVARCLIHAGWSRWRGPKDSIGTRPWLYLRPGTEKS